MDLELTDDQAALQELFAEFGAKESPPTVVRDAEPLGFAPAVWERLAQTGAPGLAVGESAGGAGATLVDAVIALEQLGRALTPVPLVEHLAATGLLARTGAVDAPWFGGLVDGTSIATLALHPTVDGVARLAPAGAVADVVVGLDGDELVAAAARPPGDVPATTSCSPVADRDLRTGDRTVLAQGPVAVALWERAVDAWRIGTAAALVGIAARSLEIGVAYVQERHQFGRPIGSFQAIQHALADLVAPLDATRLLVARAAWCADAGLDDDAARRGSMAHLSAGQVARDATATSLHVHGGYGCMVEYDIQLYFRRARGWSRILGDPDREYLRLADRLFGPTGAVLVSSSGKG